MLKAEQETTIRYDSQERIVHIFTVRPIDQRRLARLKIDPVRGSARKGLFYVVPLARFRWGLRRQGVASPARRNPFLTRRKNGNPSHS